MLFQYGSLAVPDSVNSLSPPVNAQGLPADAQVVDDSCDNSIDLANLAVATPLYWAPGSTLGGTGNWDASTSNCNWLTSPTGTTTTYWINNGQYVAVFENTGIVTLADNFVADPAGMFFFRAYGDNYTIENTGSNNVLGTLSLPADTSIAVVANVTAQISASVVGSGGLTMTGGGVLQLRGDNSYTGGTTIVGGTLNFSDLGNLGNGGITFDGGTLPVCYGSHERAGHLVAHRYDPRGRHHDRHGRQ